MTIGMKLGSIDQFSFTILGKPRSNLVMCCSSLDTSVVTLGMLCALPK